jgi:hypothetical protein
MEAFVASKSSGLVAQFLQNTAKHSTTNFYQKYEHKMAAQSKQGLNH